MDAVVLDKGINRDEFIKELRKTGLYDTYQHTVTDKTALGSMRQGSVEGKAGEKSGDRNSKIFADAASRWHNTYNCKFVCVYFC